jgi:hypothetical protein
VREKLVILKSHLVGRATVLPSLCLVSEEVENFFKKSKVLIAVNLKLTDMKGLYRFLHIHAESEDRMIGQQTARHS